MKKKIKDLTIGEFISIARKASDNYEDSFFGDCYKCPLGDVGNISCLKYCSKKKESRDSIDRFLGQEIEVDSNEEKD